ncbi:caspase domain-containing protein [Streptomyces sp. NPDC057555]|uniref:caspase family protein n=1 Tax=Streptomyces sp. NPDC057555 TaxID=3346166 RepID=UPI0036805013
MGERGRYRGLLIGNAKFPRDPHGLPTLNGPLVDVEELRQTLADDRIGLFQAADLQRLKDRKIQELREQADGFFISAVREDVLLLYYSGHGQLDERGTLYLCANDTHTGLLPSSALSSREINYMIDRCAATTIITILDCCYSGSFKSAAPAALDAGRGRYLLTSGRSTELALAATRSGQPSPFTGQLVRSLRTAQPANSTADLTVVALYRHVHRSMTESPGSTPQLKLAGEGDVVIARRPRPTPPPTVQLPVTKRPRGRIVRSSADRGISGSGNRRWAPEHAQHWLAYLAAHLDRLGTRDLAWWELGTTMSRSLRMLVVGFLAALAFGVPTGVANTLVDLIATSHGLGFALVRGIAAGVPHGLVAGLGFAVLYGSRYRGAARPSRVRIRITAFDRARGGHERFRSRFLLGLAFGLPTALVLVLVDRGVVAGLGDEFDGGLVNTLVLVPVVGLGIGLVLGITAWLEAPIDIGTAVSPVGLLRADRRNMAFHLLTWVLVFGLGGGIVNGFMASPGYGLLSGLVLGAGAACGGGLGYGLSLTAWGQWVALARIWLPLRGRLPWALTAFLEQACRRGVLRQAGAVYQFRNDHLINSAQALAAPPVLPVSRDGLPQRLVRGVRALLRG